MRIRQTRTRALWAAMLLVALAALGFTSSASAKLTGAYTQFAQCPYTNPEVKKCVYSPTEGGEAVLGSKKVPIINTAVLQGGFGKADKTTKFSTFFAAKNGITLSKASQPVPGGLAGLVPPESSPLVVKEAIKFFFENGLTGVNSTVELARSASEIQISEAHLGEEKGIALRMPIMVHLENPFLGSECYVGSATAPIWWELTTGFTAPPKPNEPIRGKAGELELLEEGAVLRLDGAELVDNAWAAPSAHGCGGFLLELLVDPILNASAGLPSAAGKNTAILKNTINVAASAAVNLNDEENP